ncbi:CsgG/HfaB family protein [Spirochaetota bacterium]
MKRYFIGFLIILLLSVTAYSRERMRIAVLDLKPVGVSGKTTKIISSMIRNDLINIGSFTVIERTQMKAILKEQGFQKTGCTDQECAVQLGKIMSARKILIGEVSSMGKAIFIMVRIVDVERGVSEFAARETASTTGTIDRAVSRIARKLNRRITGSKAVKIEKVLPEEPDGVKCTASASSDGKKINAIITWTPPDDKKIKVSSYNVYKKTVKGPKKAGKTSGTSFSIRGLDSSVTHYFFVRAVDEKGEESGASSTVSTWMRRNSTFLMGVRGMYLIPLQISGEVFSAGYGGLVYFKMRNLFVSGFDPAIETGVLNFEGKLEENGGDDKVNNMIMIPVLLKLEYRFSILNTLDVIPEISLGGAYSTMMWENAGEHQTDSAFEPLFLFGGHLNWYVIKYLSVTAGFNYGMIVESDGTLGFISVSLGMEYLF